MEIQRSQTGQQGQGVNGVGQGGKEVVRTGRESDSSAQLKTVTPTGQNGPAIVKTDAPIVIEAGKIPTAKDVSKTAATVLAGIALNQGSTPDEAQAAHVDPTPSTAPITTDEAFKTEITGLSAAEQTTVNAYYDANKATFPAGTTVGDVVVKALVPKDETAKSDLLKILGPAAQ